MVPRILIRTLSSQSRNGSWRGSPEITAYALLTLRELVTLPWWPMTVLHNQVNETIKRDTDFLGSDTYLTSNRLG